MDRYSRNYRTLDYLEQMESQSLVAPTVYGVTKTL